jgi:hypothetical protein
MYCETLANLHPLQFFRHWRNWSGLFSQDKQLLWKHHIRISTNGASLLFSPLQLDKRKSLRRLKARPSCTMVASEDASAAVPASTTTPPHNICLQTGPFYRRIRPFAIFCKAMATFPLQNIRAQDGRQLKHMWISGILIYDFFFAVVVGMFFVITSVQMIEVR